MKWMGPPKNCLFIINCTVPTGIDSEASPVQASKQQQDHQQEAQQDSALICACSPSIVHTGVVHSPAIRKWGDEADFTY